MTKDKTQVERIEKSDKQAISYYEAVGRRKEATARVRLYVVNEGTVTLGGLTLEKGSMVVNGKPVEKFFPGEVLKKMYQEPFRTTNTLNRFAVSIKTRRCVGFFV